MLNDPASSWRLPRAHSAEPVAVFYLARGADPTWRTDVARFRDSYANHPAGHPHDLVLITKGFADPADEAAAVAAFAHVAPRVLRVADGSFDLGAYRDAAHQVTHARACFLNAGSRILADDWLRKLALNLDQPGVGLVGATGSYESLRRSGPGFPAFPNPHLRSNAFLIARNAFLTAIGDVAFRDKRDTYAFESGARSLTRQIQALGFEVRVVGRDGRGYGSRVWARSDTFRTGLQANLLVEDGQTRFFATRAYGAKAAIVRETWGRYGGEALDEPNMEGARTARSVGEPVLSDGSEPG